MFLNDWAGNKDNKAPDDRSRKDFGRGQGGDLGGLSMFYISKHFDLIYQPPPSPGAN